LEFKDLPHEAQDRLKGLADELAEMDRQLLTVGAIEAQAVAKFLGVLIVKLYLRCEILEAQMEALVEDLVTDPA
jgi:hypothetical protein